MQFQNINTLIFDVKMTFSNIQDAINDFKKGKFVIGELHHKPALEYTERYQKLMERERLRREVPMIKSEELETKLEEE